MLWAVIVIARPGRHKT